MTQNDERLLGPWVLNGDMILSDSQLLLDYQNRAIARVIHEEAGPVLSAAPELLQACKAARVALEGDANLNETKALLEYVIRLAEEK